MMFRESSIPPQPGIPFEVNHNFPSLETMNIKISDKSMPFKARQKVDSKRKLLLNNFDASVSLSGGEKIIKWTNLTFTLNREVILAYYLKILRRDRRKDKILGLTM